MVFVSTISVTIGWGDFADFLSFETEPFSDADLLVTAVDFDFFLPDFIVAELKGGKLVLQLASAEFSGERERGKERKLSDVNYRSDR